MWFVKFIHIQYMLPFSGNRKLVAQGLRFQQNIVPIEQVPGMFQKVWSIKYYHNFFCSET